MFIQLEEDTLVSKQLRAFWEIESLGIAREQTQNPAEEEALRMFERTTTFKDGRCHVALPWKPESAEVQDNYRVAKRRFEGLKKKPKKDVTFCSRYNEVVEDYLQQSIAEDVPKDNESADNIK